jgi:phosphoglycolate phosphatase
VRRLDLVVFDLDGTLVDSLQDLASAVNASLDEVSPGTPPLPLADVRAFVGEGARLLVERSLRARGLPQPTDSVLPIFLDRYRRGLLATTRLYPGVAEALDALAPTTLAVLTNKPGDMSRAILEGLGAAARFARILGAGDGPARKPDPAGLIGLAAELGAEPAATAMVGDTAVDVATGRAAGALTVGVTWGLDPDGVRRAEPDLLVSDMRDLPVLLSRLETSRRDNGSSRSG